jgi:hypothetical protein
MYELNLYLTFLFSIDLHIDLKSVTENPNPVYVSKLIAPKVGPPITFDDPCAPPHNPDVVIGPSKSQLNINLSLNIT